MTDTQRMEQLIRKIAALPNDSAIADEARAIVASWPDPDLILARQIVVDQNKDSAGPSWLESIGAGETDTHIEVRIALAAIKAARA